MTEIFKFKNSYINLPNIFYSKQIPESVPNPKLVILNYSLVNELGINLNEIESSDGIDILVGNKIQKESYPISQAYAGHQFGYFTMLGDGRAVLIGEHMISEHERVDIVLKGAGKTPYSRGGDGKATLGAMIREYIISEAMNSLGIPSSRSLAVVTTGEKVIREKLLPGAVLTRIASSHIRVGTFEYVAEYGSYEELKQLADYSINRHYKECNNETDKYLIFLKNVIRKQAKLISKWQLVGFVHGVMNTDNMTISGETIDYGPCAFMDTYDIDTVFSSIDTNGRYAYGNQPNMAGWNLARFAETLVPLLNENQDIAVKIAQEAISEFNNIYNEYYISGMRAKLGLFNEEENDETIINELLNLMSKYGADYTNTFRALTLGEEQDTGMSGKDDFNNWLERWHNRLTKQKQSMQESIELMRRNNPSVIPRNHRVEEAIEEAVNKGNYSTIDKLMNVLKDPYKYSTEQNEYSKLPKKSSTPYRTFCGT